jgi:hypothetical protein
MASSSTGAIAPTHAMSKLRYDFCTYETDLRQSVGPGQYLLATPWPNCSPCLASDSRVQLGTGGVSTCAAAQSPIIDVESELYNLSRPASGCPARKYTPSPNGAGAFCALQPLADCRTMGLPTEDTRLNNPPCTLRGTGWNRWEWLCQDPQERVLLPFDALIDTAIVAKDNHRPYVACPLDQTMALPAGARSPAAMAIHTQPEWAEQVCSKRDGSRVGNGIGADGAPPILAYRGCGETARINDGPGAFRS